MKTIKVFSRGKVLKPNLYEQVIELDYKVFSGCNDEFKLNRDWWVIVSGNQIIAYCGCGFTEGLCIFVRAWVHKDYRGQGLQKKMIKLRIKSSLQSMLGYPTLVDPFAASRTITIGNVVVSSFNLHTVLIPFTNETKS